MRCQMIRTQRTHWKPSTFSRFRQGTQASPSGGATRCSRCSQNLSSLVISAEGIRFLFTYSSEPIDVSGELCFAWGVWNHKRLFYVPWRCFEIGKDLRQTMKRNNITVQSTEFETRSYWLDIRFPKKVGGFERTLCIQGCDFQAVSWRDDKGLVYFWTSV